MKLKEKFKVDNRGELGKAPLLGMEVGRDRTTRTITITQLRYTKKIISKFGLDAANDISTPMIENHLLPPHEGKSVNKPYREITGSLMYLVHSRPELSYSVGVAARHNSAFGVQHVNGVRRILRYVKGTARMGLVLGGKQEAPLLEVWTDSDHAGDKDSRKSTSGFVIKLWGSTVVIGSKKQKGISTSTMEAEFVALSTACKSLLWLISLIRDLGYTIAPITVHSDNQAAILATKNGTHTDQAKHIDVAHKFARDLFDRGLINLAYVKSAENPADILTKALGPEAFQRHRKALGVAEIAEVGQSGSVEVRAVRTIGSC